LEISEYPIIQKATFFDKELFLILYSKLEHMLNNREEGLVGAEKGGASKIA